MVSIRTMRRLSAKLIDICDTLQANPRQLVPCARHLIEAAAAMDAVLAPHLLREEREIFPALRALPAWQRDAMKAGMRERREAVLSGTAQPRRSK
jgi:hypothetical protein